MISLRLAGKDSRLITPRRAFLHEFRDLPEIPDNVAGTTYMQKTWATVDGWTNGGSSATVSAASRKIRVTANSTTWYALYRSFSPFLGNAIRLKLRSSHGGTFLLYGFNGATGVLIKTVVLAANVEIVIDASISWTCSGIQPTKDTGIIAGEYLEIYYIYFGSGIYDSKAEDYSGQNYDGTVYSCYPVQGCRENGFLFNGINSRVLPNVTLITALAGPFSFIAKIDGRARTGTQFLFARGWNTSGSFSIQCYLQDNVPCFRVSANGTTWAFSLTGTSTCDVERVISFEVSGSGSAYVARIWVDGVIEDSEDLASLIIFTTGIGAYAAIGAAYTAASTFSGFFLGAMSYASLIPSNTGTIDGARLIHEMAQLAVNASWRMPIFRADEGTEPGNILETTFEIERRGGLSAAEFILSGDTRLPITKDMLIEIWIDGVFCEVGYVDDDKDNGPDERTITISCKGLAERLRKKTISTTFTNLYLSEIIAAVETDLADLDILYSPDTLTLPSFVVASMAAKDIDLYELMERILEVANAAYSSAQYRWYIDSQRRICFEPVEESNGAALYEGYNFQKPEKTQDRKSVINIVRFFRTQSASAKVTEFVAEYTDAQSIIENGESIKKLSYSDYMDSPTCERIADGLISRYKDPLVNVDVEGLIVEPDDFGQLIPFALYGLSLQPQEYWEEITNGETLADADVTNAVNVTFSLDEAHVLMGKKAIKAVTTVSPASSGYTEFALDNVIHFPKEVRAFVYLSAGQSIGLAVVSSYGDVQRQDFANTSAHGEWMTISLPIGSATGAAVALYGDNPEAADVAIYGQNADDEDVAVYGWKGAALRNVETVRVYFDDIAGSVWIDRLDILGRKYQKHTLPLERAKYESKNGKLIASASFGESQTDIVKTIEDAIKDRRALSNIFIKE